jgi:hypothetical protein
MNKLNEPKDEVRTLGGITGLVHDSFLFNTIAGKADNFSKEAVEQQTRLILEEVNELVNALNTNDTVEVLDAAVDIQVVLSGLFQILHKAGFDVANACQLVAENNLSKFTDSLQVAELTVADLASKEIEAKIEYNAESQCYVIKDTNQKVRKPVDFKAVELTECVPKYLLKGFTKTC